MGIHGNQQEIFKKSHAEFRKRSKQHTKMGVDIPVLPNMVNISNSATIYSRQLVTTVCPIKSQIFHPLTQSSHIKVLYSLFVLCLEHESTQLRGAERRIVTLWRTNIQSRP
jgi:hypothetical protein